MNIEAARELIKKHEGVRKVVYKDSLGIPTVGVGFNLRRPDAAARLEKQGASLEDILNGTPLTMAQVDGLLDDDIFECLHDLRAMFPMFDSMPELAQLVLMDLRFNLGPTRLRTFRIAMGSFAAGKYHKAADNLQGTLWAKQVGKRAVEDIQFLRRLPNGAGEP